MKPRVSQTACYLFLQRVAATCYSPCCLRLLLLEITWGRDHCDFVLFFQCTPAFHLFISPCGTNLCVPSFVVCFVPVVPVLLCFLPLCLTQSHLCSPEPYPGLDFIWFCISLYIFLGLPQPVWFCFVAFVWYFWDNFFCFSTCLFCRFASGSFC